MRNMMLTILLATSVAMPALAQRPHERGETEPVTEQGQVAQPDERSLRAEVERPQESERANWRARGEERQQAVQQQAVQQQAVQQQAVQPQQQAAQQPQQDEQRQAWAQRRQDGNRGWSGGEAQQAQGAEQQQQQRQQRDSGRDRGPDRQAFEQGRTRDGQGYTPRGTALGGYSQQGSTQQGYAGQTDRNRWDGRRGGYRDPSRSGTNRQWTGQWRQDRNYDWRNFRDRNRSVFRLGSYYDPYGSRYRRFSIGLNLFPSYYQSNYWLEDPWMYRLPPAYGPYRWVRYYDDALLVNIYTGQVADVIYSFFW